MTILTKVQTNGVDFSGSTDLNIDGGTLFVDATNNRVGVGTSSPDSPLQVIGNTPAHFRRTSAGFCNVLLSASTAQWSTGVHSDGYYAITHEGVGERLRIDSSGRLGVGTTSPLVQFHVAAASDTPGLLESTGQSSSYLFLKNNAGGAYVASRSDALSFHTSAGATERARIDSSGRLGIGTSSPATPLDVVGSIRAVTSTTSSTTVRIGNTGNNVFVGVESSTGGSNITGSTAYAGTITSNGPIQFSTVNGGSVQATLDASGRLGIGSTSNRDSTKLDVLGDITFGANASYYGTLGYNAGTGHLEFTSGDGGFKWIRRSGLATSMVLDSSGRLLVGTSSASRTGTAFLQGSSAGATGDPTLVLARGLNNPTNGATLGAIVFTDSGHQDSVQIYASRDGGTWTSGSSMPSRLIFATTADGASSPTERVRIDNAGNLYSSQTYASTTVNAANINIQPDGRFYRSTSSIKYKTDVETLGDEYADAILNCRPVWYRSATGNDNPDWGWWGFIAEEVAEIDPRLVSWKTQEISYDDKGSAVTTSCEPEPEGVQYDRFVPHLLNLIKRQKEQIEAMEARLTALESA